MKYYQMEQEEVLQAVGSTPEGLSSKEAEKRLAENGKNKLAEGKKVTLAERFLAQMKDPMILILLAAALISAVTAVLENESFADVIIILAVVLINAVLGVYQESKAEKAIEALQEMAAATSKVMRDGKQQTVHSEELVVGDVIVLEAGDAVPADGRILESASMKIEEAALTGESVPVNKMMEVLGLSGEKEDGAGTDVPLGDRKNMVYMGSTVVYGRGRAVITGAGMETEMGKIADAISQAEDSQTPLQMKLAQLSKILSYLVIGICVFIFLFSLLKEGDFHGEVILHTFMIAVSLAVAAIPEGLAMVVTVVLSIGVTNMSKKNAIIRRLTAVETLGCAEIICSDKTGTLTQNKMTVVEAFTPDVPLLARGMALCSDAELDGESAVGEPTECALVNYAYKEGLSKYTLKEEEPRIGEAPFDSGRKRMSTVHQTSKGLVQYTKGGLDEVLACCTHYLKDKEVLPLTKEAVADVMAANKEMASNALRVLSLAYRVWEEAPADYEPATLEKDLIFVGIVGMIDPIRPEVKAAIEECKEAGITAIMITGDHRDTAVAIARQLGILTEESQAITGAQLDQISDETLERDIEKYRVYARVQPEHKVRIVNAWRKKGHITAMTGDGVNDAPSIKSADIGIGMGITGTDVTKNVADMVLADDNFATIVGAVKEGRKIYDNIRKSIQFLLASNMSEVLSIFLATLLGFTILQPVHLLWINLITDSFPALALGMEKGDANIMKRKPRDPKDGIFAGGLGMDVLYQGTLVTILTLIAYFVGHYMESGVWEIAQSADGVTMAFLTLSFAELFHSFNMRSQRESLFSLKGQNVFLWAGSIFSLILTIVILYVTPIANAFKFEQISVEEFVVAMGIAFTVIPIVEVVKLVQRTVAAKKKAI